MKSIRYESGLIINNSKLLWGSLDDKVLFKFKENISTLIASAFRSTPVLLTQTLTGKLNSDLFIPDT